MYRFHVIILQRFWTKTRCMKPSTTPFTVLQPIRTNHLEVVMNNSRFENSKRFGKIFRSGALEITVDLELIL